MVRIAALSVADNAILVDEVVFRSLNGSDLQIRYSSISTQRFWTLLELLNNADRCKTGMVAPQN